MNPTLGPEQMIGRSAAAAKRGGVTIETLALPNLGAAGLKSDIPDNGAGLSAPLGSSAAVAFSANAFPGDAGGNQACRHGVDECIRAADVGEARHVLPAGEDIRP
jgi:hypothetical protein